MSNPVPFLIQGNNIILVVNNKSHTINKDTHMFYNEIVEALKNQDWDALADLVEPKKAFIEYGNGNVTVEGDVVYWQGEPFHNALSSRLIDMLKRGFPVEPMVAFMENLMENPSKRSVEQLYDFLERNKLPITEDGHFLAYKRVRNDFKDIHSGKFDNSVGQVVEMVRNQVNDDPNQTCSQGLHFCSESYLPHFGSSSDPVMILKINPADVVSIPNDYNGAKGRCCRYEVIAQLGVAPEDAFDGPVDTIYTATVDHLDEDDFDWSSLDVDESVEDLYTVYRKRDGVEVAIDQTEYDADEMIRRAVVNKKASLAKRKQ